MHMIWQSLYRLWLLNLVTACDNDALVNRFYLAMPCGEGGGLHKDDCVEDKPRHSTETLWWFNATCMMPFFVQEVVGWNLWWCCSSVPGAPPAKALNKRMLDASEAKFLFFLQSKQQASSNTKRSRNGCNILHTQAPEAYHPWCHLSFPWLRWVRIMSEVILSLLFFPRLDSTLTTAHLYCKVFRTNGGAKIKNHVSSTFSLQFGWHPRRQPCSFKL